VTKLFISLLLGVGRVGHDQSPGMIVAIGRDVKTRCPRFVRSPLSQSGDLRCASFPGDAATPPTWNVLFVSNGTGGPNKGH